ncbi:MAG: lysine--tRNA ligase, partial [Ardenticatenaceae bacterium]
MIDPESFDDYQRTRYEKTLTLREDGIEPYPLRAERTHTSREAIEAIQAQPDAGAEVPVTVVGRVVA